MEHVTDKELVGWFHSKNFGQQLSVEVEPVAFLEDWHMNI